MVTVVGAGLAGLACALAAARAGAAVELHEERPATSVAAAHVDVVPNMMRELVRLGVGDACVRAGFPYRRTTTIGQRGTPVFATDAVRLAGPRYPAALGITSAKLQAILADQAQHAGVTIHRPSRVLLVEDAGHEARVFVAGCAPQRTDLAVLACGARGGLRERVFVADALASGAESLHFLLRRPPGLDDALQGATPDADRAYVVPVSGSQVGVRLACRHTAGPVDAAALRALLGRFPGVIGALATHVDEHTCIERRNAAPGLLASPWARGALVAVGDCAHALPPQFGQSPAQGIEDAVVLGDLLAPPRSLRALPLAFTGRRTARVQQVMAIALQAARWDAAPDPDTDHLRLARELDQLLQQPA
jgi:2-polyprenyl-6-methoxyphenol hydroxylase-like FAD-dependent oxidoreductase